MGKYADILDDREKRTGSTSVNPLGNIWNFGRAASEDEGMQPIWLQAPSTVILLTGSSRVVRF